MNRMAAFMAQLAGAKEEIEKWWGGGPYHTKERDPFAVLERAEKRLWAARETLTMEWDGTPGIADHDGPVPVMLTRFECKALRLAATFGTPNPPPPEIAHAVRKLYDAARQRTFAVVDLSDTCTECGQLREAIRNMGAALNEAADMAEDPEETIERLTQHVLRAQSDV